jgi:PAS domain S-box-containing protein
LGDKGIVSASSAALDGTHLGQLSVEADGSSFGANRNTMLLDFAASQSPAVLYLGAFVESDTVHFVSSNAASVFGLPAARLVGSASIWREHVHPDDLEGYDRAVDRVRERGMYVQDYRFRGPDGAYRWMRDHQRLTEPRDERCEYVGCVLDVTAEKEADLELQRANALNRAIVDAAMDAVITMDSDGLVRDFNPAAEQMLGYSAEEAEGVLLCDLMFPEDQRERQSRSFERYRKGDISPMFGDSFEVAAARRSGEAFPATIRMRRVVVGDATFILAEIRDLSERAAAEERQRYLTQLLRDAVESLPAGFAISDPDERIVLCNDAFADLYDGQPEDLIGLSRRDLVTRFFPQVRSFNGIAVEGLDAYLDLVTSRLGNPATGPSELELTNGEWRLVSSFTTSNGSIVTIRTDITKLKQAEKALRESEELIRMVVEACPVPVGMTRARDGLIIYESPATKRLFRRGPENGEIFATEFFVSDHDRQRFAEKLRESEVLDAYEVRLRRNDGEEFWASLAARLIEYHGEKTIVSSVYDLTERRAVEDEMSRQREALHQSEKLAALGELLASVAHELNNPLSVVVGQALLLKETAKDQAIADRASKIGSAADRCSRIVRTFLAMARQQPMERRPIDLNRVVELAIEVTAYSLRAADIDVRLSLSRDLPSVWGDADQLNQVLTNLILNAQKALESCKSPRRIKIITQYRENSREVVLKIKDNGPGIPDQIRSRIFEPFFTTRQVGTGTGIGLAFCHRIVTTHGGTIEVDSASVGGASFLLRLPVTRVSRTAQDTTTVDTVATPEANVLVVDDEVAVAEMLCDILEDEGHNVAIAHSGSQALDILATRDFDLVLSDLRMPDIDGPAMFDAIRETRPELVSRVAFITGDTMSARIRSFLQDSGRPYIEKPITPQDVRELARQILHEAAHPIEEQRQ